MGEDDSEDEDAASEKPFVAASAVDGEEEESFAEEGESTRE